MLSHKNISNLGIPGVATIMLPPSSRNLSASTCKAGNTRIQWITWDIFKLANICLHRTPLECHHIKLYSSVTCGSLPPTSKRLRSCGVWGTKLPSTAYICAASSLQNYIMSHRHEFIYWGMIITSKKSFDWYAKTRKKILPSNWPRFFSGFTNTKPKIK